MLAGAKRRSVASADRAAPPSGQARRACAGGVLQQRCASTEPQWAPPSHVDDAYQGTIEPLAAGAVQPGQARLWWPVHAGEATPSCNAVLSAPACCVPRPALDNDSAGPQCHIDAALSFGASLSASACRAPRATHDSNAAGSQCHVDAAHCGTIEPVAASAVQAGPGLVSGHSCTQVRPLFAVVHYSAHLLAARPEQLATATQQAHNATSKLL